jgi:hypothetical protein
MPDEPDRATPRVDDLRLSLEINRLSSGEASVRSQREQRTALTPAPANPRTPAERPRCCRRSP